MYSLDINLLFFFLLVVSQITVYSFATSQHAQNVYIHILLFQKLGLATIGESVWVIDDGSLLLLFEKFPLTSIIGQYFSTEQ